MTSYRRTLIPGATYFFTVNLADRGATHFPLRWRLIKTWFSRHLPCDEHRRASRIDKGERGIWQRRYWEHLIRDEVDFARHVDYIHRNPVKHEHTPRVVDWPYSTFHRFVRDEVLPETWGWEGEDAGFGERR